MWCDLSIMQEGACYTVGTGMHSSVICAKANNDCVSRLR